MKTYYISITETLNKVVEVKAEDEREALRKASDAYYRGEVVLDSEDFVDTDFNDATEETLKKRARKSWKSTRIQRQSRTKRTCRAKSVIIAAF